MTKKLIVLLTVISVTILVSCTQKMISTLNDQTNQSDTVNQNDAANRNDTTNQGDTANQSDTVNQNDTPFFLPYEDMTKVSDMVIDAVGGVHVTYQSHFAVGDFTPIYYAYCPADCDISTNWAGVAVGDVRLGAAAVLAVTPTGQPRLLWQRQQKALGAGTYVYAACDSDCLAPANWTQTALYTSKSRSQRNLTLSPEGNPRFIYTDTNSRHKGVFYAYCDTNCTDKTNWAELSIGSETQIDDINLLTDSTGILHLLFNFANSTIEYVQCSSDCADLANWQGTTISNIGLEGDISLAITSDNQPRIALYSGSLNHQTYYGWCGSDCATVQGNWNFVAVGLGANEGQQLDLALSSQNQPHIVYHSQNFSLGHVVCVGNCESGQDVWRSQIVETPNELKAYEPVPPGCTLQTWNAGEFPSLALDNQGNPLVSYDAVQLLNGCSGDIRRVRFAVVDTQ